MGSVKYSRIDTFGKETITGTWPEVGPGIIECEKCGEPFLYWLDEQGNSNKEKNDLECRPKLGDVPPRCKNEPTGL
jgi:hypothetical protein